MSKTVKMLAVICAVACLFSVGAYAATDTEYEFPFPNTALGSLFYDDIHSRTYATASVIPSVNTTATNYLLCTNKTDYIITTNVLKITSAGTYPFTFKSGYGGYGNPCCLAGYPDSSAWPWAAYTATGSWTY